MLLEGAMALHLWALQAENRSPATIKNYETAESLYLRYCETVLGRVPASVADLNLANARTFLEWLKTEHTSTRWGGATVGHGPSNVRWYARVLKVWASRLVFEEVIETHPLQKLRLPTAPKPVVPSVTREEFALMLRLCASTTLRWRNRALLLFLVETGCRIGEVCTLPRKHLALATVHHPGRALVMGKGRKERYVEFGAETSKAIAKYWALEVGKENTQPWVFLGRDGTQLTSRAAQALLKELATAAGITGKRVSPHVLRHTYGTWRAEEGMNSFRIMANMGHSSLDMTRRYIDSAKLSEGTYTSLVDGWEGIR